MHHWYVRLVLVAALQGVANRDIKLENTLLDGSPRPLIKVCNKPAVSDVSLATGSACALSWPTRRFAILGTQSTRSIKAHLAAELGPQHTWRLK